MRVVGVRGWCTVLAAAVLTAVSAQAASGATGNTPDRASAAGHYDHLTVIVEENHDSAT